MHGQGSNVGQVQYISGQEFYVPAGESNRNRKPKHSLIIHIHAHHHPSQFRGGGRTKFDYYGAIQSPFLFILLESQSPLHSSPKYD